MSGPMGAIYMSLKPLTPLAASPSLPLALQRLAHTPAARLSINYLLRNRLMFADPRAVSLAVRQCRVPFAPACYEPPVGVCYPFLPIGEEWYLDRLVTGGIIGTRLHILDRQETLPTERLEQWGAPTIGKNVDLHA